jgi:hypothetical protein
MRSARLPQKDVDLVVAVAGKEVALGLVHYVGAEVFPHDHVPRGTYNRRRFISLLLTVDLVEVLLDFVGDESLLTVVIKGLVDRL